MTPTNLDELREQLAARTDELERTQKQLKKPSTISFAERQSLSNRAGKAAAELREQAAVLEGKSGEDEGAEALANAANEALDRAAAVLSSVDAAAPAGGQRGGGLTRGLPGQQRRGVSGMSQQRAPNRSGSE